MKILVAMSGGVDSSVVAHLLKEQGHEVIGVMMKLWTDPLAPVVKRIVPTKCCSIEHIQRARSVCDSLDIPFYVLNLEEEFKTSVVDPFIEDYKDGRTPNPCIECNRLIKFGALLRKAEELGCEKLATGHYAQVRERTDADGEKTYDLLEAKDTSKDQSYFLYTLKKHQLSRIMSPLGGMQKTDVYALAKRYGVPIPDTYKESQDLCFFPEPEPKEFLKRYIPDAPTGPIKTEDGTVVGTHEGIPFYTIGQRKGLKIGGLKIPLYVVRKNSDENAIIVAQDGADRKLTALIRDLTWISKDFDPFHEPLEARIYSQGNRRKGVLELKGHDGEFTFESPVRGIAPGQSLVLYHGERLVGGGVIIGSR